MRRRLFYLMVSPLILAANVAAAVGDALREFPDEWHAALAWFENDRSAPVEFPFPDEYEWLRFTSPPRPSLSIVDICTECRGSGFEANVKHLDGDPSCRECGGSGEVVRERVIGTGFSLLNSKGTP